MAGKRVHVVLGSGGMRVLSYIGALRALSAAAYEVASLSTSSAGTIVGILLASGVNLDTLEQRVLDTDFSQFAGDRRWVPAFVAWPFSRYRRSRIPELVGHLLGKPSEFQGMVLSDLTIPFATFALDIIAHRLLVYSDSTHPDMPLSEVVDIATAAPGAYPPHERGGRVLVDGGVASALPVWLGARERDASQILALATTGNAETARPKSVERYVRSIIESGIAGRDDILISNVRRVFRIDLFCGDVEPFEYGLSTQAKRYLIDEGARAMNRALTRDLDQQYGEAPMSRGRAGDDRAESYAKQAINYFFQSEVHMGDNITAGNQAIVNVRGKMSNVVQVIGNSNQLSGPERDQLQPLVSELQARLAELQDKHELETLVVARRLEEVVELVNRPRAERKKGILEVSANGLKDAASALADAAPDIVATVGKVAAVVLGLV